MSVLLPIVVSHYTVDTPYEDEVKNLKRSLESLHLEHWLLGIKSLGYWRYNSNYCAEQVRQALEKFPDRNILRVDADAVFHCKPVLFEREDFTADVAAHVHDFRWHKNELMGGTLFFRNNAKVQALVAKWAEWACVTKKKNRNGDLLQELLAEHPEIQFSKLPATYCKIFDFMRNVENPIVEHFQASRRYKGFINTGQRGRYIHARPMYRKDV